MKSLYKAPLTLAIAAATLGATPSAFAADEPSLNINLRTLYFNRDIHGDENQIAASQAVRVDYVSPFYNNLIGFDASVFGALKLDGRDNDQGSRVLKNDGNDTDSYAKLGQAYLKLKLGENSELRAGRMVLGTPLLQDDDARSTPSSTQAITLDTNIAGADLYAIYSDRAVDVNGTKFNEYKDVNGDDYDLYVIGGGYTFANGLSVHAAHGVADEFQQTYLNASYPVALANGDSILIDAYYYDGSDDGTLYGDNYESNLFNLAGSYNTGNLSLTLSYQNIGGDDDYNYGWGGEDSNVLMTWNSVQYLDFNWADEQSLQVRADYNVAAVPGLSLMARHTEGWDIDSGAETDLEERETNLEAKYVFQGGTFEGLSLRARVAHVETEHPEINDVDEFRLIAEYGFSAL
ncbi:OprD family outer membrane porin [Marinobacterium sediminicola]|uniref:Outer membrane porin, OprD family n=1 Tax=Marinobacterium sediminicola TaxID=518898 RepID=A0ABY1RW13_9GAMM|nr:OprD family outer membrane porin [Marinobacterium sediminicola]ULG70501.1 OprD family porin [Marinobacterium sediminicola]SMR69158.1 outer membrane porin, OprD family [Marinobacterium sediminicola]